MGRVAGVEDGDLDRRCTETTSRGRPCRNRPVPGSDRCAAHLRSPRAASAAQRAGQVSPASRPDTITENTTASIERLLSAGNYIAVACQVVGLPRSTFSEWMAKGTRQGAQWTPYRIFRQRVEAAMARGEAARVAQIAKASADGDWKAAAWMLERSAPERWSKPSQRIHAESVEARTAEGQAARGSTLGELLAQVRAGTTVPGQG